MHLSSRYCHALLYLVAGATAALAQQGALSITPPAVTLTAAGAADGSSGQATLTVASPGQALPFTATVRYLSAAAGWLSLSASSGSTPATVTVSANAAGLPAGSYSAQIAVNSGTLGATADVLLIVGSSATQTLRTDETGLTFVHPVVGGPVPELSLNVTSAGPNPVTFRATASGGWVTVSPFPITTPASVSVFANPAGRTPGIHTGSVTLTPEGGGAPLVIPAVLLVAEDVAPPPALVLDQTELRFNHQLTMPEPSAQTIRVADTIGGSEFTATTTSSWLSLTTTFDSFPSSEVNGFTPDDLTVQVDPTGLTAGAYIGSITITSPTLPPQTIPVSLTVTASTAPSLNVYPSSIVLDDLVITSRSVLVVGTGSANLAFTAAVTSATPWLTVVPTSGSTGAGTGQELTIQANPGGLTMGTYNGNVRLTISSTGSSTGSTFNIPVRLNVSGIFASTSTLVTQTSSLELSAVIGTPNPITYIDVTSDPPSVSHAFTAAATAPGGWLTIDPFSTAAPSRLTVRANLAAIPAAGDHTGEIVLTSMITGAQTTIPVTLHLAAVGITAEPNTLTFTEQQRGVEPPAQTVQLTANAPSTFNVTEVPAWVRLFPRSGSTPTTLNVSVDLSLLSPGENTGNIVIVSADNRITIPIAATALAPPAPAPTPASLTFSYETGNPMLPPQTVAVASTAEPIQFTASAKTESGIDWLTVTPGSGPTPGTLTVRVNSALLVPGTQTGNITITGLNTAAAPVTVPVTVEVRATGVVQQTLLHGAALTPTPVSPGQIVTITGSGLGPETGVSARATAAGAIETQLGNTRVLFDSIPAPLLFVRNDQINAIVPYGIHGRFSTKVQIEREGTSFSLPVEYRVVDAAPGLFTLDGSGRGQAAALNSDSGTNSPSNPAARGSIISVFGTGEGQTDPQGQDGRIILTDLRRPLLPVTATIGGLPAEVLYFGSAPGLVSGVFQANIRIPENVEPGAQPIEIRVGDSATRPGVTVSIR